MNATALRTVGETFGVEEEFHIIGRDRVGSVPAAAELIGDHVEPELLLVNVETASTVCGDAGQLRADLADRRARLIGVAERAGYGVVAAGTVPDSGARDDGTFPNHRYDFLAREYQQIAREQTACACQVHVGVGDRDLAVDLLNRVRAWLPVLLALSGSSPYYDRSDTGYQSYRTMLWTRWPTSGPAPEFSCAAEYDNLVTSLVGSGVIADKRMIYFDARLSPRYPTVEIRIADGCPLLDDVLLVALLSRGLVMAAAGEVAAGRPAPRLHRDLVRAADWRAARSGLDAELVDLLRGRPVPAKELFAEVLDVVRRPLAARGEWALTSELADARLRRGGSAARQRVAYAEGGMPAVVGQLLAETAVDG